MKNENGFTMTEVLVTLAVGGVMLLLTYTFISRTLQLQHRFIDKTKRAFVEQTLNSIFPKPFAREVILISPKKIIVRYNLSETDTIEIISKKKSIRKENKYLKLGDINPIRFQLNKVGNFKITLVCEGKNYDWYILRSGPDS